VLVGQLLDDGGRGLARGLTGIAVALVVMLLLTVFVPVAIVAGVVGAMLPHPGPVPAPAAPPIAQPIVSRPGATLPPPIDDSQVLDVARRYLGVPYVFGGTNPATGLDCSGLVQLVFHQLGIGLPRTAQRQYEATARLQREQLQPGDLVFFARTYADPNDWITHVGIYMGDGWQINAPTEGQVVSIQPVFTGFWGDHFVSGGRVGAGG
jgi:cell wall-associated NlpC family hydrolase